MRIRKVAILIDGAFFVKRLKQWPDLDRKDPQAVAKKVHELCKRHIQKLIHEDYEETRSKWLDHVYRLFYYDAEPYTGDTEHPLKSRLIKFGSTPEAKFRKGLFNEIRKQRKFALRLGSLKKYGDWTPYNEHMKGLLKIWHHCDYLTELIQDPSKQDQTKSADALQALSKWKALAEDDVGLPLQQKGVDMRIGIDIVSMTLKRQVDTIVLVTGDSDFIPAAKIARREGVEFILDPLWQGVESKLSEHVDGVWMALPPG